MWTYQTITYAYSVVWGVLFVFFIYGFILFVKIAKRLIKALDIYINKSQYDGRTRMKDDGLK